MGTIVGGIAAFIVGSALAGATLVGVVSNQTAAPDEAPVTIGDGSDLTSVIEYGSND